MMTNVAKAERFMAVFLFGRRMAIECGMHYTKEQPFWEVSPSRDRGEFL